ncbi:MAG: hypothetical protein HYT98_03280 [Candidatus Sungbacteria bacterium]|nr:hypothetical protein [Candidatus Sungbacteria bacterium]
MNWLIWLVAQWWFYPAAFYYLFFGALFGSLNYWVAQETDQYPYWLRFLLYPVATVLREGWWDGAVAPSHKPIVRTYVNFASATTVSYTNHSEAICIVVYSLFWTLKVLFNLSVLVVIFTVGILVCVYAFIAIGVCKALDGIADIMMTGISVAFRAVRPTSEVDKNAP